MDNIDIQKTYCVYMHTSPSGKSYIGITCKKPPETRWSNGNGYKRGHPYFWKAICKYGWDKFKHNILFDGLTQQQAYEKEKEMIALYDTANPEKGYNMTKGGDGKSGYIMSKETKYKISKSRIGRFTGEDNPNFGNHKIAGKNNPFYGKTHSAATKKKLSELARGRSSPMKGKHFSEEALRNLLNARKKKRKPVLQFDLLGHFLNKFECAEDAARTVDGSRNVISGCCKGRSSVAYGYIWIYEENYDPTQPVQKKPRKQRDLDTYFSKAILQYTVDGVFVKEFVSTAEAHRQTNINVNCIKDCCRGRQKTAGGFIWRYKDNGQDKKN